MKKQKIKSLALQKKTISRLDQAAQVKGGAADTYISYVIVTCTINTVPEPDPLPETFMPICPSDRGNACPSL